MNHKTITAHHEAGHAFGYMFYGLELERVTIISEGIADGRTSLVQPVRATALSIAVRAAMGPVAEERYLFTTGMDADDVANFWEEGHCYHDFEEIWTLGQQGKCAETAKGLVAYGAPVIDALAAALLTRGTLTGAECRKIYHENFLAGTFDAEDYYSALDDALVAHHLAGWQVA